MVKFIKNKHYLQDKNSWVTKGEWHSPIKVIGVTIKIWCWDFKALAEISKSKQNQKSKQNETFLDIKLSSQWFVTKSFWFFLIRFEAENTKVIAIFIVNFYIYCFGSFFAKVNIIILNHFCFYYIIIFYCNKKFNLFFWRLPK